jgi:hypothetical protein
MDAGAFDSFFNLNREGLQDRTVSRPAVPGTRLDELRKSVPHAFERCNSCPNIQ